MLMGHLNRLKTKKSVLSVDDYRFSTKVAFPFPVPVPVRSWNPRSLPIQSMAEGFARWESDPLFSAAEVVQDSADRMEYAFRELLHEQSISRTDPSDSKLLNLLNCHRRDLATTLETTKWQLEDFERAVHFAALSDTSNSRENAILRHRQFIRAIREQILQVDNSVKGLSTNNVNGDSQYMDSNEQETDGLALFLSGGDSKGNHLRYKSGSDSMRRFLDSATDSNEIVELKSEEAEPSPTNGLNQSLQGYNLPKDHTSWKADSQFLNRYDTEAPYSSQASTVIKEFEGSSTASGAYALGQGGSGAKFYIYRNRLMEYAWSILPKILLSNKSKGSFTQRRKDGEITDKLIHDDQWLLSSAASITPAEKSKCIQMPWTGVSRTYQGCNLETTRFHRLLEVIWRTQRSWYLIIDCRFSKRLPSVVLIILILVGLVALYAIRGV